MGYGITHFALELWLLCEREMLACLPTCYAMLFLWHTPVVFYMTLQSSPSTSLAGPPSGPAPSSTCILKFVFPAAREAINRADSSASMERYRVHVSKGFNRSRTQAMEAGKRALVESHFADDRASLLVRREHASVPQTSKQQLEEMTVGKLRRSVVRTC
jgi:hypothetical protein